MLKRSVVKVHLAVNIHPSNIEGEVVALREIFVVHRIKRLPVEHGLLVIRRAANDRRAQMVVQQLRSRNLHIRAHVVSVRQGGERICALAVVKIRPTRNRVL